MRVLVACEKSGIIREAFRKRGHEAYSADLEPSEDNSKFHLQGDIRNLLDPYNSDYWDLVIAHPPCTYLSVTGNRWLSPKHNDRYLDRRLKQLDAMWFFLYFIQLPISRLCIENPVGIMSTAYRKPDQYIQPYQFGHDATKKTGLWLFNLPKLLPTKVVKPTYKDFPSGKRMSKWYYETSCLPHKERAEARSRTFQGIADAMAEQWGIF